MPLTMLRICMIQPYQYGRWGARGGRSRCNRLREYTGCVNIHHENGRSENDDAW